jgi:hypothetical protein
MKHLVKVGQWGTRAGSFLLDLEQLSYRRLDDLGGKEYQSAGTVKFFMGGRPVFLFNDENAWYLWIPEIKEPIPLEDWKPLYIYDSSLFRAVAEGDAQAAAVLFDKGVLVNTPSLPGLPPLLTAALFGRLELARLLLMRGADPNLRYECRVTPLLCAVRAGDVEMVRLLLDAGAPARLRPREGFADLGMGLGLLLPKLIRSQWVDYVRPLQTELEDFASDERFVG